MNVNGTFFGKALVDARIFSAENSHDLIANHNAVDYVAVADEVRDKRIFRLVVNIFGRADLLNVTLIHDDDAVAHRQSLFLVVRHEDKRNARLFVDSDEFAAHVPTQFQIQSRKRLVKQKNFRLVDDCAGNGNSLLLTAAQSGDVVFFVAFKVDEFERVFDFVANVIGRLARDFRSERNIFLNVHVGKEGILLENGVNRSSVRRQVCDVLAVENHAPGIGHFKAADDSEHCRLAATRRSQQRDEISSSTSKFPNDLAMFSKRINSLAISQQPFCQLGIGNE